MEQLIKSQTARNVNRNNNAILISAVRSPPTKVINLKENDVENTGYQEHDF